MAVKLKKKRRIFMLYAGILLAASLFPGWIQDGTGKRETGDNGAGGSRQMEEALEYVGASVSSSDGSPAETGGEEDTGREESEKEENQAEEPGKKKIALTFDDGPSARWTPKLLDGLKERNIKATFFLIGEYAADNEEIVKRLHEEGHLIGNHTYTHVSLAEGSVEEAEKELKMTDKVIYDITGEHTGYVRPPFGLWREELEEKMQVLPVMWNIDPLDWQSENTGEIVRKVVTEAREDAIILLHDCYGTSVEAALAIVDILTEEGYVFVTADEIIMD